MNHNNINWENCLGVYTGGARAMVDHYGGFHFRKTYTLNTSLKDKEIYILQPFEKMVVLLKQST